MFTTNKSLETILGTFTKVQDDLKVFVERTTSDIEFRREQARVLNAEADAKGAEVSQALSVMDKIEALVS